MTAGLIVFSVIHDISAAVCMLLLIGSIMHCKERSRVNTVVTLILALAASVTYSCIFFCMADGGKMELESCITLIGFVSTAVIISASQIVMRIAKRARSFLVSLSFIAVSDIFFGFYCIVSGTDMNTPGGYLTEEIFMSVIYVALIVFFVFATRNKELSTLRNVFDTMPGWIYYLSIFFSFTAYCFAGLKDDGGMKTVYEKTINILFVLMSMGIMFCIGYFIYKIFALSYQQTQILKQLSAQHEGYETMLKSDDELRQFRHDYKNHMMVVTAFLNSGRSDEAADYLEKIKIRSGIAGRQFSTGNFVIDAILNNKNTQAEEYGIHIDFSGAVPESGIENSDICTVASNLIDNAIESTKSFNGSRYIKIESTVRNGFLVFSVSNPVGKRVEIKNNRIKTSKSDTKNHGIGLNNVEKTAKLYSGRMLLSCDDEEFTADVNMKLIHGGNL